MMENYVNPVLNVGLSIVILLTAWVADAIQYVDLALGIITKIIPVITFICFGILNYKNIIINTKEIYKKVLK